MQSKAQWGRKQVGLVHQYSPSLQLMLLVPRPTGSSKTLGLMWPRLPGSKSWLKFLAKWFRWVFSFHALLSPPGPLRWAELGQILGSLTPRLQLPFSEVMEGDTFYHTAVDRRGMGSPSKQPMWACRYKPLYSCAHMCMSVLKILTHGVVVPSTNALSSTGAGSGVSPSVAGSWGGPRGPGTDWGNRRAGTQGVWGSGFSPAHCPSKDILK